MMVITFCRTCTPTHIILIRGMWVQILKGNRGIAICCKAGDLVVWDSRTAHCNTPGFNAQKVIQQMQQTPAVCESTSADEHNKLIRMVTYICMVPAARVTDDDILLSRILAYMQSTQTSHWPDT